MAQESFDYIFNIEHKPNKPRVLLALPMYMYRIQTFSIEYGVNFFQKAVLMFKTKPGIDNQTISECLGLDINIVNLISRQLVNMRLIGKDGRLTENGQEIKNDIDGLIVDEEKKSIGYIFQHINDDELYPFYVNKLQKADVLKGKIRTGTNIKGDTDEEDFYEEPITAKKLLGNKRTNPAPDERDIIGLIRRSNKHTHTNKNVDTLNIDKKKYGITFVPDNHPTIVWVCTYAYVPRIDDEIYSSEWELMDPFGFGNNNELKYYVDSLISDGLIEDFTTNFQKLKTVDDQTIEEFQKTMAERVDKEMDKAFEVGYHKLDKNVVKYLRAVLKNYLMLNRTIEIDTCSTFVCNIQNVLETIIKLDFERNETVYKRVNNEFKYENRRSGKRTDFFTQQSRYDYIEELFCYGGLKADFRTQNNIKGLLKTFDPSKVYSLKHYLVKFLFAHKYNDDNPLYEIIKEKVDVIYKIANQRNLGSHGQTSNERQTHALHKDEIDKYWEEIKQIVNNYIINCNGKEKKQEENKITG